MSNTVTITFKINEKEITKKDIEIGTQVSNVLEHFNIDKNTIYAVLINNELCPLDSKIKYTSVIEPILNNTKEGSSVYRRSLCLLLAAAAHISRNTYDEFIVSSTSGSVHIDDSVAKRLSVDSTSGSLKINGKYNAFALHAISGSIRMEDSISPDSNCEISAVSGSIYLNLPKQSGFNVNYDLGSGSYHNHLTGLDGKKGSETVNAGGPTIYVKANSGSVHVNKN